MTFCSSCGAELRPIDKFCYLCGAPVYRGSVLSPVPAGDAGQAPQPEPATGISPVPAGDDGQAPQSESATGISPVPAGDAGQALQPEPATGMSPVPAGDAGQALQLDAATGISPVPAGDAGQALQPEPATGISPVPAGDAGQALQPEPATGISPVPAGDDGQAPPPDPVAGPAEPPVIPLKYLVAGIVIVVVLLAVVVFSMATPDARTSGVHPSPTHPAVTLLPVKTTSTPVPKTTAPVRVTTAITVVVQEPGTPADTRQVYRLNQKFNYANVTYSCNLSRPPLYVRFTVTPDMVSHHRLIAAGMSIEQWVNTTDIDPQAWLDISVIDTATGEVVEHQGFGKDFAAMTSQEFMVREPGSYRIVMSGNKVDADIRIFAGTG